MAARVRREPPRFRRAAVRGTTRLGPRMVRVSLSGPELVGFTAGEPAASVRLLLPSHGAPEPEMPTWTGNEFRLADGRRPTIRTLTPRRADPDAGELDVEVVVHGHGAASAWATGARPGDVVAVSGPGRGYAVDPLATSFLLAGDETALPAIGQLLETLPTDRPVEAHVEVAHPSGRLVLPGRPRATVRWHDLPAGARPGDALVAAVAGAPVEPGTQVWVAGEAAAVQRVRRDLFERRGVPRTRASVRGYWKHGRAGDGEP